MVKSVVFAVAMFDCSLGRTVNFYTFDKNSDTISSKEKASGDRYATIELRSSRFFPNEPVASLPHCHVFSGYASSGCKIYRVGGLNVSCSECTEELGWHPSNGLDTVDYLCYAGGSAFEHFFLPSMPLPRREPKLVFAAGKLFVIGGSLFVDPHPILNHSWPPSPGEQGLELTTFVEYYDPQVEQWIRVGNPDDGVGGLNMGNFVCGVMRVHSERDLILVGSHLNEHFIALAVNFDRKTGVICHTEWVQTQIKFDDNRLFKCYRSPPAVVDLKSRCMMWIDCLKRTQLIVLCCDTSNYYEFNLGKHGLLPSPNCMHYCPQLLSLGDDLLGLVWKDKHRYKLERTDKQTPQTKKRTAQGDLKTVKEIINKTEKFGGYHLTKFEIRIGDRKKKLVIHSDIRCIGPGGSTELVAALTLDLPSHLCHN